MMRSLRGRGVLLARLAMLALLGAVAAPAALAAEQPDEAPHDFRNAQSNAFGSVAMTPYLRSDGDPVQVEATFVLRDLDALARAARLLVALNLHEASTRASLDSIEAGGRPLQAQRTDTTNGGLQQQVFLDPADVLPAAQGGEVVLRLRATAEPTANGQFHVGALLIAFDVAWGTLRASDGGSAELYGFSMLMASGLPSPAYAPLRGQGNTALVLPVFAVAAVGTVAGARVLFAAARDRRQRKVAAATVESSAVESSAMAFSPALPDEAPLAPTAVFSGSAAPSEGGAAPSRSFDAVDIPAFGSAAPDPPARTPSSSARVAPPAVTGAAPTGPVQGPRVPPGFAIRPWAPTPMPPRPGRAPRPAAAASSRPSKAPSKGKRPAASQRGSAAVPAPARRPGGRPTR